MPYQNGITMAYELSIENGIAQGLLNLNKVFASHNVGYEYNISGDVQRIAKKVIMSANETLDDYLMVTSFDKWVDGKKTDNIARVGIPLDSEIMARGSNNAKEGELIRAKNEGYTTLLREAFGSFGMTKLRAIEMKIEVPKAKMKVVGKLTEDQLLIEHKRLDKVYASQFKNTKGIHIEDPRKSFPKETVKDFGVTVKSSKKQEKKLDELRKIVNTKPDEDEYVPEH